MKTHDNHTTILPRGFEASADEDGACWLCISADVCPFLGLLSSAIYSITGKLRS